MHLATLERTRRGGGACRELHELQVCDAGEADAEEGEEGVRVVAHVEEDFGRRGGLEDVPEGEACGGAGGGEGGGGEGVDVDEVGFVEGGDVDLEDGDGAVAGEVDAFEVEVEGRGCGGLVVEDVHEG
jgi:hypothetical protein